MPSPELGNNEHESDKSNESSTRLAFELQSIYWHGNNFCRQRRNRERLRERKNSVLTDRKCLLAVTKCLLVQKGKKNYYLIIAK